MRRILGNDKSLHCDHCEFDTRSKTLLTRHVEQHHGENEDSQEERDATLPTMRSRLNCTHCEYKTTSDYVLKRHTEVHHKETKAVTCATCEERFKTNKELKKHMNDQHAEVTQTQPGRKPSSRIACDLCGQRFNKRDTEVFTTTI